MKYTVETPNGSMISVKGDKLEVQGNNIVISRKTEIVAVIPSGCVVLKVGTYDL